MIKNHNANNKEFIRAIQSKKLYCYGAGKVYQDFRKVYSEVSLQAVIDKNMSAKGIAKTMDGVPVISIDNFIAMCDDTSVLLITCFDYQEIEKELEEIEELQKLPCYVYFLIQGRFGIADTDENSNKYQIAEFKLQDYCAGQKAPADVAVIAAKAGYKVLTVNRGTHRFGLAQTQSEWQRIADTLPDGATVLIQLPLVDTTGSIKELYKIKEKKHIKIIAVVHDIDMLRGDMGEYHKEQYKLTKAIADVWIVHNDCMIQKLSGMGFPREKMVRLGIFDYLAELEQEILYDDGIIIAGNLDRQKSAYIYKLNQIGQLQFNLFGTNYITPEIDDNMHYYGAFMPDDLLANLRGRYGLVWDGDSIETCSGAKGEYLRYNNPHKLSLYLAVGLPVIIWSEAAEADFVLQENVGIVVDSLKELPNKLAEIGDIRYNEMKACARRISRRLRNGDFLLDAINQAEERLNR